MPGPEVDDADYRFTARDGQSAEIAVMRQDDSLVGAGQPENREIVSARHAGLMQLGDMQPISRIRLASSG